jgi:hypothetical protein
VVDNVHKMSPSSFASFTRRTMRTRYLADPGGFRRHHIMW